MSQSLTHSQEIVSPEQKRKEFETARNVYIIIFLSFLTVCGTAVYLSMKMEAEKTGFQAIQTDAPTSFFDKTYMKKNPESTH